MPYPSGEIPAFWTRKALARRRDQDDRRPRLRHPVAPRVCTRCNIQRAGDLESVGWSAQQTLRTVRATVGGLRADLWVLRGRGGCGKQHRSEDVGQERDPRWGCRRRLGARGLKDSEAVAK